MTIQRIGTTEGLKDIHGVHVVPVISLAIIHDGIVSTCGVTAEPTGDVRVQTKRYLRVSIAFWNRLVPTNRNS